MYGSIVPWNGVMEDQLMDSYQNKNAFGMVAFRNSMLMQSSGYIINTRTDTWFNLDTLVTNEKQDNHPLPPTNQSISHDIDYLLNEVKNIKSEETQVQQPISSFPILPSFIDAEDEDLLFQTTSDNDSSMRKQPE